MELIPSHLRALGALPVEGAVSEVCISQLGDALRANSTLEKLDLQVRKSAKDWAKTVVG